MTPENLVRQTQLNADGLYMIIHDAKVVIECIGIAVEKGFQEGGRTLRKEGYNLKSLAIVESMDPDRGTITFAQNTD